jgi:hypothetical protein
MKMFYTLKVCLGTPHGDGQHGFFHSKWRSDRDRTPGERPPGSLFEVKKEK